MEFLDIILTEDSKNKTEVFCSMLFKVLLLADIKEKQTPLWF
jgi:hypothetical protein